MGIAMASGLPPASGLVTGIIGGVIVGLLAGAPLQVSGPAAGLAVIVFELVHEHGILALGPVLMIAGAIQLVAGLLKTGRWFRAISPEVIHGMLAGIGILIVIQQFHVVLDRTPEHSGLANIGAMWSAVFGGLFPLNGSKEELAALLGVITLAIILLWEKFMPASLRLLPRALLGISAATSIAQIFHFPVNRVVIPTSLGAMIHLTSLTSFEDIPLMTIIGTTALIESIAGSESLLDASALVTIQKISMANYDSELAPQVVGN